MAKRGIPRKVYELEWHTNLSLRLVLNWLARPSMYDKLRAVRGTSPVHRGGGQMHTNTKHMPNKADDEGELPEAVQCS